MVSELILFQLSSFCALMGMTLGWRGVMTRFSGFYDLPTAWSQVFWGIVLGGLYAVAANGALFEPYYNQVTNDDVYTGLNIISLVLVTLLASIGSHFLLRRKRVRKGGSQPTSGWALGLAVGGMIAMVLMYHMFGFEGIFSPFGLLNIALISVFTPRAEALITAKHGYMMLQDKRWGAILRSTFWRSALLVSVYSTVFDPLIWVFILPFIFLATPASETWIWESIPREGRRRLRRIWADQAREKTSGSVNAGRQEEVVESVGNGEE
jgi:hypothetical protein